MKNIRAEHAQEKTPLRARAYLAALKIYELCTRGARGLFDGFWLGLLDREACYAVDIAYYRDARQYHDADYNRGGLWDWETAMVDRYFAGRRRLLVTAAGGGREVLALRRRGFDVVGFECNAELVAFANDFLRGEGVEGDLLPAPRDGCPLLEDAFDGVIVGWGAYMLIQGSDRRIDLLRRLRELLEPGAPVLLSFFVRRKNDRYYYLVRGVGNLLRVVRFAPRIEFGDALDPNFVHRFIEAEISYELSAAGFRLEY